MEVEAEFRTWAQVLRDRMALSVSVESRLLAVVVVLPTHEAALPCGS